MTTPDLTPTLRSALEKALSLPLSLLPLDDAEWDALVALRNACPEPRWLPTEDGLAVHVESGGARSVYYVRDGKVSRFLCAGGGLLRPEDPDIFAGTWEPCPEVTR